MRPLADLLKEQNIVLKGADPVTQRGFTQVPNFLLDSKTLSPSGKLAYAMLLHYAWQNDFCFPGQERLAADLGVTDRSVRNHLKELEKNGLLTIVRRGQGKTNVYELNLTPKGFRSRAEENCRSKAEMGFRSLLIRILSGIRLRLIICSFSQFLAQAFKKGLKTRHRANRAKLRSNE